MARICCLVAPTTCLAVVDRSSTALSRAITSSVLSRSTLEIGLTSVSARLIVSLRALSVLEVLDSEFSTRSMSPVLRLASARKVFTRRRVSRTSGSRPPRAVLSSSVIVRSWSSPPPLISSDTAARVFSTVGAVLVSASASWSPSSSGCPERAGVIWMNSSPRGVS